jgi:hypothetical protein
MTRERSIISEVCASNVNTADVRWKEIGRARGYVDGAARAGRERRVDQLVIGAGHVRAARASTSST